jgi:flagellar assembly protein FliH
MTSSSPEPRVLRGGAGLAVNSPGLGGELRTGQWTRLGNSGVLGDATTEGTLQSLAERSRKAARAQGYAKGWAEGHRAGEAHSRAEAAQVAERRAEEDARRQGEHDATLRTLEAAARSLDARLAEVSAAMEEHVVEAALRIAEAVIGRELAIAADAGADAVRRALSVMPHDVPVFTLHLNPADHAVLDRTVLAGHAVTVVADPTVARGDAIAETDTTVIDASVAAGLARVREVLAP